jgi:hypothetical protein
LAIAAAALLLFSVTTRETLVNEGNPDNWTERGLDKGLGPEVHLKMAVQLSNGDVSRLIRGTSYAAGDTLFFKVDTPAAGRVYLIRVEASGFEILHQQDIMAGSENLKTPQGSVGYELESGETSAVFAIARFDTPISDSQLKLALSQVNLVRGQNPDTARVCIAVRELGGRCSAERVEGVQ